MTSQFSEGSTNISVMTILSGLQKHLKIGRPRDITFWRVELRNQKPYIKYRITNLTHIKEQEGLLIVPDKIRFDETDQCAAGSANVYVTRFAERSENSEGLLTSDIDSRTDRLETTC